MGRDTNVLLPSGGQTNSARNFRREVRSEGKEHPSLQTPSSLITKHPCPPHTGNYKDLAFPAKPLGPLGHPQGCLRGFQVAFWCCLDSRNKSLSDNSLGVWAGRGGATLHNTEIHLKPDRQPEPKQARKAKDKGMQGPKWQSH